MYSKILEMIPPAYRITLVGLGEPLLQPDIIYFVKIATSSKSRVALVTNASKLNRTMSDKSITAGLDSISFSIDGPDQIVSNKLRHGTNFKHNSNECLLNLYAILKYNYHIHLFAKVKLKIYYTPLKRSIHEQHIYYRPGNRY